MKLKKIASLMLAGVMAVSMLAGCQNANVDPEKPEQPDEPTSSATYAEMLKSELTGSAKEMVTPVANADLDAALKNAVDKYFDYNSGSVTDEGPDNDDHITFDDLADGEGYGYRRRDLGYASR